MQLIASAKRNAPSDMDPTSHQLQSATTLVMAMKKAIDKCAGFHIRQSLLDLFVDLKSILGKYVGALTDMLPRKPKTDQDYQLLCAIGNTSSLLLSIVDSLAIKVEGLVDDNMKPAIVVEDVKDLIGTELRRQLLYIADVLNKELEGILVQIGSNSWDPQRVETGKVPQKLTDIFGQRFTVVAEWLANDNMNRFRSTFAQNVTGIIHDSMFKQKQVTMDAASRIHIAVRAVKALVMCWTQADSTMAKRRIDHEFRKLEGEVTVLCSPDVALSITYVTLIPSPSREHLKSILKLRAIPNAMHEQVLSEFDEQLAQAA
jgi:hypothetical protein